VSWSCIIIIQNVRLNPEGSDVRARVTYLIGHADVGRRSTRQCSPTVSILVLQSLGGRSEAIHVGYSTASRVMTASDGDVDGFRFTALCGRRRRVKNEKNEGEKY
jgi:hypothetical protein